MECESRAESFSRNIEVELLRNSYVVSIKLIKAKTIRVIVRKQIILFRRLTKREREDDGE